MNANMQKGDVMNINSILSEEQQFFTFLSELSEKSDSDPVKEIVERCKNIGIHYLSSLKTLDLSHCALKEIPESIRVLKNLKVLELINNQLTHLPKNLSQLEQLNEIRLENNDLEDFPASLLELAKKRKLEKKALDIYLHNNPMELVPFSIKSMIVTRPFCALNDHKA